ncbi:MAG: phosphate--acyl-ACP acyltransferase, partial [Deltaproteobacteria bacterium]|nr:phosphate--acyl-ACP acyltransferase [Deltaproteobacteria bacterium]
MRVAVDAMGGDNAPAIEVEGAVAAARLHGIPVVLVGDEERLRQELLLHNASKLDITIHHASE